MIGVNVFLKSQEVSVHQELDISCEVVGNILRLLQLNFILLISNEIFSVREVAINLVEERDIDLLAFLEELVDVLFSVQNNDLVGDRVDSWHGAEVLGLSDELLHFGFFLNDEFS